MNKVNFSAAAVEIFRQVLICQVTKRPAGGYMKVEEIRKMAKLQREVFDIALGEMIRKGSITPAPLHSTDRTPEAIQDMYRRKLPEAQGGGFEVIEGFTVRSIPWFLRDGFWDFLEGNQG